MGTTTTGDGTEILYKDWVSAGRSSSATAVRGMPTTEAEMINADRLALLRP